MVRTGINDEGNFKCIDICTRCGNCKTKVADSRLDDTFSIRLRTKECTVCGKRWTTAEVLLDDLTALDDRELAYLKMIEDANKELTATVIKMKEHTNALTMALNKVEAIEKKKKKNGGLKL